MGSMQVINIGTTPGDGTGDNLRVASQKINENFDLIGWKGEPIITGASITIDTDATNHFIITALAESATFNAPAGTPVQNQKLLIRIKDNGSAQSLTWNAAFRAVAAQLPATSVAGKTMYIGFIYNSTDLKWDCLAYGVEN